MFPVLNEKPVHRAGWNLRLLTSTADLAALSEISARLCFYTQGQPGLKHTSNPSCTHRGTRKGKKQGWEKAILHQDYQAREIMKCPYPLQPHGTRAVYPGEHSTACPEHQLHHLQPVLPMPFHTSQTMNTDSLPNESKDGSCPPKP